MGEYVLAGFTVNMEGCRYTVRPCLESEPGAERVLRSEPGFLLTEKHEIRNPFVLPINEQFAVVTMLH